MTSAREVILRCLQQGREAEVGGCFRPETVADDGECADGDCYCSRWCERRTDTIFAALDAEGLALVRSDFVASKMVDAAHFLLCYNYQGFAKDDPPRDRAGNCIWRVWHLAPEARGHMTAAEQELFDALMPQFPAAAIRGDDHDG